MIDFPKGPSSKYIKYLVQANHYRQKRDYRLALNSYSAIIAQFGESVYILQALAFCYFGLGLYEDDETNFHFAIQIIKKAINLAPNNDQLHDALGEFYSLGTLEYQEAAKEYRTAIELNPYNLAALLGCTALYGVPEKVVLLDDAIAWFERIIQLVPNDPTHHFRLSELYQESGQLHKAETERLLALLCPSPATVSIEQAITDLTGTENL